MAIQNHSKELRSESSSQACRITERPNFLSYFSTSGCRWTGQTFIMMALIISFLSGCGKEGLFEGVGPIKTVQVSVGDFSEIVLNDKVNLIITYDQAESVRLEAGENLLDDIELTVSDKKLTVRDNTKFRWARNLDYTINLYVNHNHLKKISYHGAGNVTTTNTWRSEEFTIDSWTGVGTIDMNIVSDYTVLIIRKANADIKLRGKSTLTSIYCADYGTLDLKEFETTNMTMDYRSVRNSVIFVTTHLKADILYKGDVYYKGTPVIESLLNSTGKLVAFP